MIVKISLYIYIFIYLFRKIDNSIYWNNGLDNLPNLEENNEIENLNETNETYKNLSRFEI